MARAQVFVLSSIYEGFGNVVAEALSVGTSVVATDCESGPSEILAQGQFGHLVPVKDPNALAAAIIATLDQPQPPEQLKSRARDFTIDTIVDSVLPSGWPHENSLFLDQSGQLGGAELCLIGLAKHYGNDCLVGLFAPGPFFPTACSAANSG